MKKIFATIVFTLLFWLFTFGHSGRTDRNGGHWNHKTGKYHYHNSKKSGGVLFWIVVIGSGVAIVIHLIKDDNHF
jgi:hypothetical protein